eukprot:COSAG06_NODE_440_length_15762_cov_75.979825_13_plen_109_part_00
MDSVGHREVVAGAAFMRYAVAELVWALAVRGRADLDMLLGRVICTPTTPTHTSAHTHIVRQPESQVSKLSPAAAALSYQPGCACGDGSGKTVGFPCDLDATGWKLNDR